MLKNTLVLLRFPFSVLLLPVYLWALCHVNHPFSLTSLAVFFILHLLVYPASNGYNSYMDKDTEPIGGLQHPPPPDRSLFYASLVMDTLALVLAACIQFWFFIGVAVYIVMSRLYSYRGIRLKRFPILGFLTVFCFQGAWIFFSVISALTPHFQWANLNLHLTVSALVSSCLIGAIYPLTQIYQHQSDLKDGVKTLSYVLGYRGTFLFSGICFALGVALLATRLNIQQFIWFNVLTFPTVLFFAWWFWKVYKNTSAANFKNAMRMNIISCLCMNSYYIVLLWQA